MYCQVRAIWKLDFGRMVVCNSYIFLNSNLLLKKNDGDMET